MREGTNRKGAIKFPGSGGVWRKQSSKFSELELPVSVVILPGLEGAWWKLFFFFKWRKQNKRFQDSFVFKKKLGKFLLLLQLWWCRRLLLLWWRSNGGIKLQRRRRGGPMTWASSQCLLSMSQGTAKMLSYTCKQNLTLIGNWELKTRNQDQELGKKLREERDTRTAREYTAMWDNTTTGRGRRWTKYKETWRGGSKTEYNKHGTWDYQNKTGNMHTH